MRKVIGGFITLAAAVSVLGACAANQANTLTESELTDREKAFLSINANESFVYDFNVNDEFSMVQITLDKYEFGALTDYEIVNINLEVSGEGSIVLITSHDLTNREETHFNVAILNEGSTATYRTEDVISDEVNQDNMMTGWSSSSELGEIDEGEIVLGSISYTSADNLQLTLPEMYEDVDGYIESIENVDAVYILKAQFSN